MTLLKTPSSQNVAISLTGNALDNTLTAHLRTMYVLAYSIVVDSSLTRLMQPVCPVCHLSLTIDLDGPALELEENRSSARQGILGRLDLATWRSSTKIEALIEELSSLRQQDAMTKSLVFSQFVNFLDLIAFRLQKAGFNVSDDEKAPGVNQHFYRYVASKER